MKRNTCDLLSRSKSVSTFCFHLFSKTVYPQLFTVFFWILILCFHDETCEKPLVNFQFSDCSSLLTNEDLFVSVAWLTFDGNSLSASLYALPFICMCLLVWYWKPWVLDECRKYKKLKLRKFMSWISNFLGKFKRINWTYI